MSYWNKWLWVLYGIIKGWLSPNGVVRFNFIVGQTQSKKEKHTMALTLSCNNEQKIKVSVHPVTLSGTPTALDGPITVEVQSGDGTFEMVDDVTFYVISGPGAGLTNYLVSGDADLGAGVVPIQDIVTLDVSFAMAASLGLIADAPEPK